MIIATAPEREKRAYRLRCAFRTNSGARGRSLELATREAGYRFISDMEKQGWDFRSRYGLKLTGPFPWDEVKNLDPVWKQEQHKDVGRYVTQRAITPAVDERTGRKYRVIEDQDDGEKWVLSGIFVRPEIVTGTQETS